MSTRALGSSGKSWKPILGIVLVLAILATVGAMVFFKKSKTTTTAKPVATTQITELTGVIGSEKKQFFEDARVQQALASKGLKVNIETAGSREIATSTDLSKYDFAFPSSAPAAQKIQEKMKVSNVYSPFYSPMAIATFKPVIEVLSQNGVATQSADGVWHINMAAYLNLVKDGKRWNELAGATSYNSPRSVLITSTDIRKSNSAAMYLSMGAYVLNGNNVVSTSEQQSAILPELSKMFLAQGFSASSSEEPFQDYLTQGAGALPMVMIYESQFVGEAAKANSRISDQMVLAYPDPTVFSKHTLIPLKKDANKLGEVLTNDPALVKLEAEYGFRTNDPAAFSDVATAHNIAVENFLTNIAETPSYDVLESLITAITDQYNR